MAKNTGEGAAQTMVVGMDVGDRKSQVCVRKVDGEVEATQLRTTTSAMESYFSRLERCRVVLEAGTHSPWIERTAARHGHEVLVVNPYRVRLIAESVGKGDRADAVVLAELGWMGMGLLQLVEHRSAEQQEDLEVLRARALLVRERTALVAHVRMAVKTAGGRIEGVGAGGMGKRGLEQVPAELREALAPVMAMIAALSERIREYDRMVEKLIGERYPVARHLQQVRGVGPVTSLTFVLTIGEPGRFRRSRQVGAYFGLVPRRRQSGGRDPELGITRAGDGEMRRLLVQCAHHILSHEQADSDLRRWGLEKAKHGKNAHKRAVIAVARKLAVLLHRLWISGEVYEPFHQRKEVVASA
jgi:transposase